MPRVSFDCSLWYDVSQERLDALARLRGVECWVDLAGAGELPRVLLLSQYARGERPPVRFVENRLVMLAGRPVVFVDHVVWTGDPTVSPFVTLDESALDDRGKRRP